MSISFDRYFLKVLTKPVNNVFRLYKNQFSYRYENYNIHDVYPSCTDPKN